VANDNKLSDILWGGMAASGRGSASGAAATQMTRTQDLVRMHAQGMPQTGIYLLFTNPNDVDTRLSKRKMEE